MPLPTADFWSKAPCVKLLIALIAGIILQWQLQFSFAYLIALFAVCLAIIIFYFFIPLKTKYRLSFVNGITASLLIALVGAILVWLHDIRHNNNWIGNYYKDSSYLVVTLEEPLVEKPNSYKALATTNSLYDKSNLRSTEGQIILYFRKDSSTKMLHYGSQIIFKKSLQEIKNAGNPGSFDYKRYSLFQGITHQAYLSATDFEILPTENKNQFRQFIFNCRSWVVKSLQKNIYGEKEQGLAEALLIGYKDDLDKTLIQSYTNTGVVHIIAISGMHLALIYALLVFLTKPIKGQKNLRWFRVILILSGLWLFTILAGAQASVARSAVMFTCIALGEGLSRKTSVNNTLALSAFLLLCYNPFWLWDVGFQLSYAAVLSIVNFYRPIYNWFYIPNKLLDGIWKIMAISIAAQIITTPISLYHFHQFPVLFLFTNLVAVPLSGLILFGEIILCAFSWLTPFARFVGWLSETFIYWMNSYIERLEKVSFSLWNGFSISMIQMVLLTIVFAGISYWLMEKKRIFLRISIFALFAFIVLRSISFANANQQNKLIVYNVPRYLAIDLVNGRNYNFIGDSALLFDDFTRNFHIQPSRVLHRVKENQTTPVNLKDFEFCNKRIVIIDSTIRFLSPSTKQPVDILILSKNPKLYISNLTEIFSIDKIIIDGSVPGWKAKFWKRDCDSLHIPYYDVSEQGAFVMNMQ